MTKSKTTLAGILAALVAILNVAIAIIDGDPSTTPDFAIAGSALLAAIGLLFAKDDDPAPSE